MTRWVIVSTTLRGVVDPPEPVDTETQAKLEEVCQAEATWRTLPRRAYRSYPTGEERIGYGVQYLQRKWFR
jgi:hypothetical protein